MGNNSWILKATGATLSTADLFKDVPGGEPADILKQQQDFDAGVGPSTDDGGLWGVSKAKIVNYGVGILTAPVFLSVQVILTLLGFIFAGILIVVGLIFDAAINLSINNIGPVISGLNGVWVLFRDLVNVFFIFILLYIAIKKILGSSGFDEKKALGNLILNAILVNFSLFIAKFLIDVGNIIAVAFYNQVSGGGSISSMILDNLHIKDLFTLSLAATGTGQADIVIVLLAKIFIVGTTIYVFFWGTIIFLGRAVMLIYLVVTSPVAYFGNSIPRLKGLGDNWWKEFTDQVLVAPVFMIFMIIISRVLQIGVFVNAAKNGIPDNAAINVTGYFVFILVTMLLIKALKETKKLSGEVADTAMKVVKGAAVVTAAAVTGGAAMYAGGISAVAGAGAAEAAAGKTGLAAARARLSFAGKTIATNTGKFIKGDYAKEPGYGAKALSAIRETTFKEVPKAATQGLVDIPAMQKVLEKAKKENEKNILAKGAGLGANEEDKAKLVTLKAKSEEITKKAQQQVASEGAALEKQRDTHQQAADKALGPNEAAAAQANVQASEAAIAKFKKDQESRLKEVKEQIAKTENVSLEELEKLTTKVGEAETKQANYAKQIEESGILGGIFNQGLFVTQLTKKARTDLAKNIRKGKRGDKSPAEQIKDLLVKEIKDEEKGKEGAPAEKKTNVTPPEAH
jgi:hypothetical protein